MALYEFDENNIVKSSAVDKNGYYRDGGMVLVEDVFPMRGYPDTFIQGSNFSFTGAYDLNSVIKLIGGNKFTYGRCYVYFGDNISDFDFQFNTVDNMTVISNYQEYNLLPGSSNYIPFYRSKYYVVGIVQNAILPENWKDLKMHLIITFQKRDENNQLVEGVYGYIQIHQR